jgi:hypothetical protein
MRTGMAGLRKPALRNVGRLRPRSLCLGQGAKTAAWAPAGSESRRAQRLALSASANRPSPVQRRQPACRNRNCSFRAKRFAFGRLMPSRPAHRLCAAVDLLGSSTTSCAGNTTSQGPELSGRVAPNPNRTARRLSLNVTWAFGTCMAARRTRVVRRRGVTRERETVGYHHIAEMRREECTTTRSLPSSGPS